MSWQNRYEQYLLHIEWPLRDAPTSIHVFFFFYFFFVSWGNKFVIIEWPPFDAPSSTHGVFTSFSLSRCCCLHFYDAPMVTRPFSSVIGMSPIGGFKNRFFFLFLGPTLAQKFLMLHHPILLKENPCCT